MGFSPLMALPPERRSSSREPLHNFTLPPNGLKWGNQKFLRCIKLDPNSDQRSLISDFVPIRRAKNELNCNRRSSSSSLVNSADQNPPSDDIEAVREKIMLDLRDAGDKMKISMLEEKPKELDDQSSSVRPWNLRTRRAACKEPKTNASAARGGGGKGVNCNLASPARRQDSRLRGGLGLLAEQSVERAKFSIRLCKEEIESDLLAITGNKPQRRPKKRPRAVQRQLDALVPGLWLTEIMPESYKVPDVPEPGKG